MMDNDTEEEYIMIRLNSLSRSGLIIYRSLDKFAKMNKPPSPQVYQIDEIFILHTDAGTIPYVSRPDSAVPLALVALRKSGDIDVAFADGAQEVWVMDAEKKTVTRHQKNGDAQILTIGDHIGEVACLHEFVLEIAAVFED